MGCHLYANVFLTEHWGADSLVRSIGTDRPGGERS